MDPWINISWVSLQLSGAGAGPLDVPLHHDQVSQPRAGTRGGSLCILWLLFTIQEQQGGQQAFL